MKNRKIILTEWNKETKFLIIAATNECVNLGNPWSCNGENLF